MNRLRSVRTRSFDEAFRELTPRVQRQAVAAYRRWREDPSHPGPRFKRVGTSDPLYSVRINDDYRAVCLVRDGTAVWFWIGPHDEYDRLLDAG